MQVSVLVLVMIVAVALLLTARHRSHPIDLGGDVGSLGAPGERHVRSARRAEALMPRAP
jgi:hypothetical protein